MSSREVVENLGGIDKIIAAVEHAMRMTMQKWDACLDASTPSHSAKMIKITHRKALERGVKTRYIIEITKDNLQDCKQIITDTGAEVRHSAGIRGSFAVSDTIYISAVGLDGPEDLAHGTKSNDKEIVEHQQQIFDTLWHTAIPGSRRIRELEQGFSIPVLEIIEDSKDSLHLAYSRIRSANREVLVVFSTPNALRRNLNIEGVELLKPIISRGVKVMLLIPHDSQLGDEMKKLRSTLPQIEIREVDESLKTKITVIVVDKTESFIFETKDDDASALENAVGESVHYSGGGTSLSIASIFYSLWRQAELYEKLKGVDSIKDEFVNIAAHELRTPILPIILSAENLQDRYPNDENVKVILRNATRMIKLAGDILDVSRIDSSTLILQKQKNNIINLIQEVIQDSLVKIPDSKGLQIIRISDVPVDMREFLFDKNRVRQVVENLLDNAIKFSQGGTIKIAISKNPKDERQVAVSVIDEGEGINPSLKDKLFEKFISEPSQTNGTGLGLYICRALVQAHGGTIDAKPNPMGQGAIFTFTLPFSDGVHIS